MSNNFYFKTWLTTLARLEILVDIDREYQRTKVHDQTLSDAVHRLTAMLGQYMTLYNEAVECVHNNLQVQKTVFMEKIIKAEVARIQELKLDLQKLEGSHYLFFGSGLIMYKQTTYDAEMTTVPTKTRRLPPIQAAIENAFERVKEKREVLAKLKEEETEEVKEILWFMEEQEAAVESKNTVKKDKKDELTGEARVRRDFLILISAHEKTRQVTRSRRRDMLRRLAWEKELDGTAEPPARYEIREKSAKLLQKLFRAYFEIKRKRIRDCKRDQILGLKYCEPPNTEKHKKVEEINIHRSKLHYEYKKQCSAQREKLKKEYLKRKGKELAEDCRDRVRDWFYEWFESIHFIHDIPDPGSVAIFKEEVPEPHEWLQEYEALMKQKADSRGKTPQELKYEAQERATLEKQAKKEEQRRQRAEALLLEKMMKHPTMHPGYHYPQSKKTKYLVEAIRSYHATWDNYDAMEIPEAKKKFIQEINLQDAYINAKLEILKDVDEIMEAEHLQLKRALREDYKNNNEEMPEQKTVHKEKKHKKLKAIPSQRISEKVESLAWRGFIVEYPRTRLDEFIGDPNFAGEDLRRKIVPVFPHNYEVRALWWERCHAVTHGSHRILLVGPDGSGKIKLVHALASINDAVLFEMDPLKVPAELLTPAHLKKLISFILACAKAVQPSVIHIRHVQKLFYAREPPEEAGLHLNFINKYFLQRLIKKVHKHDKITIIGSCKEPWIARSSQILKQFPIVVMLPNTSYSIIVQMLKEWVLRYHSIPNNFDVGSLAYVLQGYSYGSLHHALETFMSDERIVRTAAYGLTAMDVYNYILEDVTMEKIEYDSYLNWYWEKTPTGIKEKQHFDTLIEFKTTTEALQAKEAKKANIAKKSAATSMASSLTAL